MTTLTELQSALAEIGEPAKIPFYTVLHQSGLYRRVARGKLLMRKRHMSAQLVFAKK
jgi:hypothetical protein